MIEFLLDMNGWYGWIKVTIKSDEGEICIDCAWHGDAPRELLEGFLSLADGGGHADLCFTDERRDYIVRLRRVGDVLSVTVKRVNETEMQDLPQRLWKRALESKDWSRIPMVQGKKACFRGEGPFRHAVASLIAGIHGLLAQAGCAEEYKNKWDHTFPSDELSRLEKTLSAL